MTEAERVEEEFQEDVIDRMTDDIYELIKYEL